MIIENKELNTSIQVEGNVIVFYIDGQYGYGKTNKKFAVTKWLLSQFQELKKTYKFLVCSAYGDENKSKRIKAYEQLGFVFVPEAFSYVWESIPGIMQASIDECNKKMMEEEYCSDYLEDYDDM